MRTTRMIMLAAAVALVVAGCADDGTADQASSPASGATSQPSAETTVTPTTEFPPEPVNNFTELTVESATIRVAGSPRGGSVVCHLSLAEDGWADNVRCDMVDGSAAQTSVNKGRGDDPCNLAQAVGTPPIGYLAIWQGQAELGCPTDTVGYGDTDVAVGDTVRLGSVQCTALQTGFVCMDVNSAAAILVTVDEWNLAEALADPNVTH